MKTSPIVGWILVIVGLAAISFGLLSAYNIFTGKAEAPVIFRPTEAATAIPAAGVSSNDMAKAEQILQEKIHQEITAIIPADYFSKILNLISWSTFIMLLVFAGTQVAGLGIKLIKE